LIKKLVDILKKIKVWVDKYLHQDKLTEIKIAILLKLPKHKVCKSKN
jgi:hypothetical protein